MLLNLAQHSPPHKGRYNLMTSVIHSIVFWYYGDQIGAWRSWFKSLGCPTLSPAFKRNTARLFACLFVAIDCQLQPSVPRQHGSGTSEDSNICWSKRLVRHRGFWEGSEVLWMHAIGFHESCVVYDCTCSRSHLLLFAKVKCTPELTLLFIVLVKKHVTTHVLHVVCSICFECVW